MPTMANVTVKANDGSTDIVYTAIVAAAGDKTPAVWRANGVGDAAGKRPEVRLSSQNSGQGSTSRRLNFSATYPSLVTSTDTGVTSVADRLNVSLSVIAPLGMTQTAIDEGVSQFMNFLASTLVKDSMKSGYAPV
jgi:hypothetical protein